MIAGLKRREPVSILPRETRKGLKWGRWIYGLLLSGFASVLLNYSVGSTVFLRADGLVLQKHFTVAPPYEAAVTALYVQSGEHVERGTPLAQLESAQFSRSLAELASRRAELASRLAQVKSKLVLAERMLPFATEQHDQLQGTLKGLMELHQRNLANTRRVEEALTVSFAAREKVMELQAQSVALNAELEMMEQARREADLAYRDLKRIYGDGRVLSPADGIVGPTTAAPGDLLVTGSRVMEIYTGEAYILAYLPDNYIFHIQPGQKVLVSAGTGHSAAWIEAVLPVADSLPPEFQSTFRPRDRSQLVRIRLGEGHGFATRQKVRVTDCMHSSCGSIVPALASWMQSFAFRVVNGL